MRASVWVKAASHRRSAKRFVNLNPWVATYVKYYDKVKDSDHDKRIDVIKNYAVAYENRCFTVQAADNEMDVVYDDYRRLVYATDALGDLDGWNDRKLKEAFGKEL